MIITYPWWWRQYALLKRRSTIILHGGTSQKTILNILQSSLLSHACHMPWPPHSPSNYSNMPKMLWTRQIIWWRGLLTLLSEIYSIHMSGLRENKKHWRDRGPLLVAKSSWSCHAQMYLWLRWLAMQKTRMERARCVDGVLACQLLMLRCERTLAKPWQRDLTPRFLWLARCHCYHSPSHITR
jgi:hypothetical protein